MHGILYADVDDLDLDARSRWLGRREKISIDLCQELNNQYKHARLNYVSHDLDFENIHVA